MRTNIYKEKALLVTASIKNFDGDVQEWREAFYELWRHQMTWGFAYNISVIDGREGVFVDMVIKPAYREAVANTLESLGYRKVQITDCSVGLIPCTDVDNKDLDIEHIEIDW